MKHFMQIVTHGNVIELSLTLGSWRGTCISDEVTTEVHGLTKPATRRQRSLGFELEARHHCANLLSGPQRVLIYTYKVSDSFTPQEGNNLRRNIIVITCLVSLNNVIKFLICLFTCNGHSVVSVFYLLQ
jgi:hypothetical protein